jgi:hypothetical protein
LILPLMISAFFAFILVMKAFGTFVLMTPTS